MDLSVIPEAVQSGVIGLLAGIGGGYLYCWLHHRLHLHDRSHQ